MKFTDFRKHLVTEVYGQFWLKYLKQISVEKLCLQARYPLLGKNIKYSRVKNGGGGLSIFEKFSHPNRPHLDPLINHRKNIRYCHLKF